MVSSHLKGSEFEGETRALLIQLRDEHPDLVSLIEKPTLQLQNGEIVVPDFQLIVQYSAETRHYIIECQDRTHYSHSILHKIQHIRAKQALKTFFFVYRENISPELERAMDEEGVVHRNLTEFREFLSQVSNQLDNQPERPKEYRPPTYAGVDGNQIYTALGNAARRLGDAHSADPRRSCIAIGLYFVEDYEEAGGGKAINTIKFLRDVDREHMNPFASYYIGWFDYGWCGSVKLVDEPEFFDRAFRAERAVFRRDVFPFAPTGYDLVLCDVWDSPGGAVFRFSTAVHLDLSILSVNHRRIEEILLDIMQRPGEESSVRGSWVVEGGLLASQDSVVGPFVSYLERQAHGASPAFCRVPGARDFKQIFLSYGKVEV
jgi:hypothetical protein